MTTPLTKVTQAHNAYLKASTDKTLARERLAKAIATAREAGYTHQRIGALLGTTKQAISNIIRKGK